ncbi:MAG: sulfurtransferase complex subunit TusB [Hahellaceae bacterium]|nr:sulfurtransferase complex subunit TusB [Hahellaceae bacterium]MCP5212209.1 sulfurtransferase complex subunit TusB [Hahellaceae bacterium]
MLSLVSLKDGRNHSILLLTEGVFLLQHDYFFDNRTVNPVYFISEDAAARGINTPESNTSTPIDYNGFVDLVTKHQQVVTW